MDFELNKEQLYIQKAAREFADAEFDKDYILELERNHQYPWELAKKASELGFIAINYPEEYGGQGYGLLERVLVTEEFCRQGAGVGMSVILTDFGCKAILAYGTEEQKKRYLIPMCQGKAVAYAAFTEPDRGSDLVTSPLGTSAVKDGDGYLINGAKTFITNGSIADFGIVLCQTDFEAKPIYRGQSLFVLEKEMAGIDASDWEKMGNNQSPNSQMSFNNVRASKEHLIGEEGKGFYYSMDFLTTVRMQVAGMGLGIAQGALDRALEFSKTREAFGVKIGEFQAISHKLAEMATKIEASRLLTYKAAWGIDKGETDLKLCSMAKWYSARTAVEVADEAIEILGGSGYMLEYEVERFYRDARCLELVEGTREIHKNAIARALLGKLS